MEWCWTRQPQSRTMTADLGHRRRVCIERWLKLTEGARASVNAYVNRGVDLAGDAFAVDA